MSDLEGYFGKHDYPSSSQTDKLIAACKQYESAYFMSQRVWVNEPESKSESESNTFCFVTPLS